MAELTVQNLKASIGAEIAGIEPGGVLGDEAVRQLRAAFDERSVLVFRNLDMDEDWQRYLIHTLIGEPPPAGDRNSARPPMLVSNKEKNGAAPYGRLLFHCDSMWARHPQRIISLYGVQVEQPSAPTQFVSMGHAWDTLPENLRDRVANLEARHGFDHQYPNRGGDEDVIDTYYEESRSTVRPVGFRHPRTGRTMLYVSQQATIEILGLPSEENESLLEELFAHLYRPADILEHDWRKGDLVAWDNVAVQHGRGSVALEGPPRTLRKVIGPLNLDPDEMITPVYSKVANT